MLGQFRHITYSNQSLAESGNTVNLPTRMPPAIRVEARYEDAAQSLMQFLDSFVGRVIFTADSPGRRESVFDLLAGRNIEASRIDGQGREGDAGASSGAIVTVAFDTLHACVR